MILRSLTLLALTSALLHGQGIGSQEPAADRASIPGSQSAAPATDGSTLTVYLMTMGYGDAIWERFGHNAIRIVDAVTGTDSVFNWGTFDFDQPNFVGRFMTGNTLYWMQADGMRETLAAYRYLNRSMWVQELDLTPAERAAVRNFITWNAREENRYYRYDYYLDNCSTRIRDLLDRIVAGQLKAAISARLTTTTYRFHTQRALAFDRTVAMGSNLALGEPADRPITEWEEAFLPGRLQAVLRGVQVRDSTGATHPLVKTEQQLFAAQRVPEPTEPPAVTLRNLVIGVGIAGVLALLAVAARNGARAARIGFTTLATLWAALNGILGVALVIAWSATRHVFMAQNENLLQFDPLSLVLAVMLPFAISRGGAMEKTRLIAAVIAVASLVGLAIKIVPAFDQKNVAVILLALPVHLVIAWAVRMLSTAPNVAPSRPAASAAAARSAA